MPAFVTHKLFGDDLLTVLPEKLRKIIEKEYAAYFWGLQGPDLLFYKKGLKLPLLGNLMHREKTDELLSYLQSYVCKHADSKDYQILLSYVIGFMCHYSLDVCVHPVIYSMQLEKGNGERAYHHRIESDLDTVLFDLRSGFPVRIFRIEKELFLDDFSMNCIARLYKCVLSDVYGIKINERKIVKCFSDTVFFIRLCVKSSPTLTCVLKTFERIAGQHYLFSSHLRLKNSKGLTAKVAEEMLSSALNKTVPLIIEIFNSIAKGDSIEISGLPSFNNRIFIPSLI
ncbi:MAG: zinc dependent phospholipase C family protein [Bacillota bacterium]|nr:zinc dependent phospholipase C family protein [Bacillota bacterium]